jgi:hypothetical protein
MMANKVRYDQQSLMSAQPSGVQEVLGDARREAVEYWKSLHPNSALIPIGEINGIMEIAIRYERAGGTR